MPARVRIDPAPGERSCAALALANTVLEGPAGGVDLLTTCGDITDWLAGHGADAGRLRVEPADVARVDRLRAAVRGLFTAVAAGRPPASEHVSTLNTTTAAAPGAVRLLPGAAGPARGWAAARGSELDIALARLAADAVEVATGDRRALIRQCEAHSCSRVFLTEHARRRWCCTGCGDRVRAARHYRRVRHDGQP